MYVKQVQPVSHTPRILPSNDKQKNIKKIFIHFIILKQGPTLVVEVAVSHMSIGGTLVFPLEENDMKIDEAIYYNLNIISNMKFGLALKFIG